MSIFTSMIIDTPIGQMIAVSDDEFLYSLDVAGSDLGVKFERVASGITKPLLMLQEELTDYFAGKLQKFTVPLCRSDSSFRAQVWHHLFQVPFGSTVTYAQQAAEVGNPKAYRAVARACSLNPILIVVPCHRVINSNGKLGGYRAGLEVKKWLLNHEGNRKA